ncbi:hypothetical protein [Thalassotalea insulae]|nr:hypothetical protein [Thalassotalea insulae]
MIFSSVIPKSQTSSLGSLAKRAQLDNLSISTLGAFVFEFKKIALA